MWESRNTVFRKALQQDIPDIMKIIDYAREEMLKAGKKQWDLSYPTQKHISDDVAAGYGYVLCVERDIAAYGAVIFGEEPSYRHIRNGAWLSSLPYVVVHRLAVSDKFRRQGLAVLYLSAVEDLMKVRGVRSFKIDTNFDNKSMQSVLDKQHFHYCGEIEYERGTRMAYEKLISYMEFDL